MAHFPASRVRGYPINREAPCRLTRLTLALRLATALAAPAAMLWPAAAAQAQAAPAQQARSYRIPAGPLAENLARFADHAGVTVLFDATLVGQRRGAGLNGEYTVADGFARLLAGSGLAARERSPGVFVLQALPQPGVAQLAPVTVQGEGAVAAPAWETRTDRKRMDDLQIKNWSDLGKRAEPGVSFNRQNNSINIRGLDQDRVLTRVDGIRLPWLDDGARGVKGGLEAVDFNTLSRLDVVRGADAGSGGSGAISGLADLYTLSPADLLTDGKTFGALAKTDYDTADSSWGANAALAGQIHDNTFWLVQAGVRNGHALDNRGDVGGYGPRRSEPTPEDYDQRSFLLKLQQRVDGGHRFGLTGEYFKRNATQDSMFEQGPGTSYQIGENTTKRKPSASACRSTMPTRRRARAAGSTAPRRWCTGNACSSTARWMRSGLPAVPIAFQAALMAATIPSARPCSAPMQNCPSVSPAPRCRKYGRWEPSGTATRQSRTPAVTTIARRSLRARPGRRSPAPATCCTPTRPTCRCPRAASGPCGPPTNSASPTAATRSCRRCATTITSRSPSPPKATPATATAARCRPTMAAGASRPSCWPPGRPRTN